MELADVTDSKSVGLIPRVGSSPTTGTMQQARTGLLHSVRAFLYRAFFRDDTAEIRPHQAGS